MTRRPGTVCTCSIWFDSRRGYSSRGENAGAAQQDVGVVVGEAFGHPQRLHVVLVLVVERAELDRAQPLDVPVVEVLVRERAEPAHVGAVRARREAAGHAEEAVLVLEPAARLGDHVQEVVVRIRQRAHHALAGVDDLLHVGRGPVGVDQRGVAFEQHHVPLAVDGELARHRVADDDRAVDEGVEVVGAKGVRRAGDRLSAVSHPLPRRRQLDAHFVRPRRALDQREERRRAVEHREAGLDPVVADGHLAAVDPVAQRHARRAAGGDLPAVLGRLLDGERARRRRWRSPLRRGARTRGSGTSPASTSPCRPRPAARPAGGNRGFDLDVVRVRRREAQRVTNRLERLRIRRDAARDKRRQARQGEKNSVFHSGYSKISRCAGVSSFVIVIFATNRAMTP